MGTKSISVETREYIKCMYRMKGIGENIHKYVEKNLVYKRNYAWDKRNYLG
jgi:hypothetical protein